MEMLSARRLKVLHASLVLLAQSCAHSRMSAKPASAQGNYLVLNILIGMQAHSPSGIEAKFLHF